MISNGPAFASALFLVVAMSLAGVAHLAWLKSPLSKRFSQPLDAGLTFRGRRIFGPNKMLRGFMVMPVAAAVTFAALAALRERLPGWLASGIWDLTAGEYALLGFACGLAFMLAELPNSFLKRQFDVPPGEAPDRGWLKPVCFVLDRCDSVMGVMVVVALTVPAPLAMWLWVLILGPMSHALFSAALHGIGEKLRPL
jgi:CDP-2,3-bis-(O-geranylgeranyl)-sn-glycerol synthase